MRWHWPILALLLGLLFAPPAHGETRAILIGVSRYQSAAIPDLMGPANDLTAMEGLAQSMQASDVVSLRDGAVSRSSVETTIHDMGLRAMA